jgi:hypothetical protein
MRLTDGEYTAIIRAAKPQTEDALDRLRKAVDKWDATLSSYCDGPERDEVHAASLSASRIV